MFRQRIIRCTAVLIVLWYVFSIIGFDVHTCSHTGKSYVATFVSGYGCDDIHPEHHCGKDCCHGHRPIVVTDISPLCDAVLADSCAGHCCEDSIKVLALTGVSQSDGHHHYNECHCGHCLCIAASTGVLYFNVVCEHILPDDMFPVFRDILSLNSVLRI